MRSFNRKPGKTFPTHLNAFTAQMAATVKKISTVREKRIRLNFSREDIWLAAIGWGPPGMALFSGKFVYKFKG
jgi:hypothetical protein